ncbi:MAG TPA: type II secretion system F family protein [Tetrasphaera sp.]|jgi:tight adherence protein B|nr:type II secretion system F family protein [Tetrasphaera sp.]
MSTTVMMAACGALIVAGVLGLIAGLRPTPVDLGRPGRASILGRRWSRRTWTLIAVGAVIGMVIATLTGWVIAVVAAPAALAGVPALLSSGESAEQIARLEAMEEWARSLANVLTVGMGLEQALVATHRVAPPAIATEVTRLTARVRAGRYTADAIREWADEVNDATGDLIAANLVLAAKRRGDGLTAVLRALADSVAEDVRIRRQIEAQRRSVLATARFTTGVVLVSAVGLGLFSDFMKPYGTPLGQVLLTLIFTGVAGALAWLRRMARPPQLPRFIGPRVAAHAEEVRT